jgi:hypothetical protein
MRNPLPQRNDTAILDGAYKSIISSIRRLQRKIIDFWSKGAEWSRVIRFRFFFCSRSVHISKLQQEDYLREGGRGMYICGLDTLDHPEVVVAQLSKFDYPQVKRPASSSAAGLRDHMMLLMYAKHQKNVKKMNE